MGTYINFDTLLKVAEESFGLEKKAGSAWRSATNLPKVLSRVGKNPEDYTTLASRLQALRDTKGGLGLQPRLAKADRNVINFDQASAALERRYTSWPADRPHPKPPVIANSATPWWKQLLGRTTPATPRMPSVLYRGINRSQGSVADYLKPYAGHMTKPLAHGSARLAVAGQYARGEAALPVIAMYGAAPRQRHYRDFGIDNLLGKNLDLLPKSQQLSRQHIRSTATEVPTDSPVLYDSGFRGAKMFETPIRQRTNPLIGYLLGRKSGGTHGPAGQMNFFKTNDPSKFHNYVQEMSRKLR